MPPFVGLNLTVRDTDRTTTHEFFSTSLAQLIRQVCEAFQRPNVTPTIHLDDDGTEIDDEEYFQTLEDQTDLIAVFPGQRWFDPNHYVTITTHCEPGDATDAAAETRRIKQIVGELQNNLCNVTIMGDPDLDTLSNMDPNSLVDLTGKDFMEHMKDSGRPLCAKRNAQDRINLLKLLKDGAIFCSERYPEEAEAIDQEISRQLNLDTTSMAATVTITPTTVASQKQIPKNTTITITTTTIEQVQNETTTNSTSTSKVTSIDTTTEVADVSSNGANIVESIKKKCGGKDIEIITINNTTDTIITSSSPSSAVTVSSPPPTSTTTATQNTLNNKQNDI